MSGAQPESPNPPSQPASDAAIDIDLYCLHCGYNLRGLSGDPVRCPECGYRNPRGDVELPADQIRRQLRRMETAPAVSVAGLIFMLLAAVPAAAVLIAKPQGTWAPACLEVFASVGGIVWLIGIFRFRGSCLRRPGWFAVLLRYQLVALALAGLILVIFGLSTWYMDDQRWRWNRGPGMSWPCFARILLFGAVVVAITRGLRPIHRWLKAPMEQLQREVAVRIARDRIRREMAHRPSWRRRI
jgi:hypothetical protein